MRASRLLSILILLQLRTRLTAAALAEEFGVSERTIHRDIDQLSAAGVPVYGERGPGGGFQLLAGYRTKLTGLHADEAEAMFLLALPGAAQQLGLGAAAQRARGKLLAAMPGETATLAGRLQQCFHVDPEPWYQQAEAPTGLPALTRAVLDQRRLALRYASWTASKRRRVDPLGLVQKAGDWYLVARGERHVATFKVAAMSELEVLAEGFERPPDFDLARWWAESLQRFEAGLRPLQAKLRLSATGRRRLAEAGRWAADAVHAAGKPDAAGWAPLTLPIESIERGALLLLSLGPEVEALAPPALREQMRSCARAIARRHASTVTRAEPLQSCPPPRRPPARGN